MENPVELSATPTKQTPPLLPNLLVSDLTIEGIFRAQAKGKGAIGICSDEGATILSGVSFSKDNRLKTVAGLCRLWDGAPLDRARGGEGLTILYNRRCSLHILAQAKIAASVLTDPILQDQGFLARCLVAWPPSTAGTRRYRAVDLSQDPRMLMYWGRVRALLSQRFPANPKTPNELTPRSLILTPAAKALWVQYHDAIETQLADEQPLATIRPFAAKAAEIVARIAAIFQHFEEPQATEIDETRIQRAIAIMDYYLTEALRIAGMTGTDPDLQLAEKLLAWARSHTEIYLQLIYRNGPRELRDAATTKRIAALLETYGHFTPIPGGREIDGVYHKIVWRVAK